MPRSWNPDIARLAGICFESLIEKVLSLAVTECRVQGLKNSCWCGDCGLSCRAVKAYHSPGPVKELSFQPSSQ